MVSFKWGGMPKALPESNDFMQTEIKDFILNTKDRKFKKTFLYNLKKAVNSVNNEERPAFKDSLKGLYDKVLEQPLQPVLEQNPEAWKKFATKKSGKGSSPNESNMRYITTKTIGDIMDNKTRKKLTGMGAQTYGKNQQELPNFDFDDWWQTQNEDILSAVQSDVVIRESEAEGFEGQFSYSFKKPLQGLDAHFEFDFPPFDSEKLINFKTDWLEEEVGVVPRFKTKKSKSNFAKDTIPHSLVIPEKNLNQLREGTATNWVQEQEYQMDEKGEVVFNNEGEVTSRTQRVNIKTRKPISEEDYTKLSAKAKKNYESPYLEQEGTEAGHLPTGDKIILTNDEKDSPFTNIEVIAAIGADPKLAEEKSLVRLGDKVYSYYFAKGQGKSTHVEWSSDENNSPFDFIEKNKTMFMRMIDSLLINPTQIHKIRILGNIKTERKQGKTLARQMQSVNYPDKDMGDKATADNYEILRHMLHKKTGKKLSLEEYNELEEADKKDYEAHTSKLSLSEIQELGNNAFRHKETGVMLSEEDYGALSSEDKNKYESAVMLLSSNKEGSAIDWKYSRDMGKVTHSSGTYTGYSIPDLITAFANASIECTVEVTTLGEFNLQAIGRSVNRDMKEFIDSIKANIRGLSSRLEGV